MSKDLHSYWIRPVNKERIDYTTLEGGRGNTRYCVHIMSRYLYSALPHIVAPFGRIPCCEPDEEKCFLVTGDTPFGKVVESVWSADKEKGRTLQEEIIALSEGNELGVTAWLNSVNNPDCVLAQAASNKTIGDSVQQMISAELELKQIIEKYRQMQPAIHSVARSDTWLFAAGLQPAFAIFSSVSHITSTSSVVL